MCNFWRGPVNLPYVGINSDNRFETSSVSLSAVAMKITLFVLIALAALATTKPISVLNYDLDDIHHDQDINEDAIVTGSYTWTSPEGEEFFVRYIADENGFRIVESNAVPVSNAGVRVDGQQGSFVSSEEFFDDRK
ncbi:uncharacterized protein [Macrobrachium rosenbergii]|uniref:uncharacterized protein n=1 Tax=Macrobrachium rosenbergii TaxID=79674 RepID=UPI0034D746AC